ncbi:DUF2975 domain-containing protein [Companilactobacillus allii]|uniref:DUF2975 domain-containing protein n=1 Tax=Companilactobacillus allii TaxID=1847728 RepID=A0A1P8Q0Y9_9LACO|nr:DUF2975 domain-containing protein [Companilactobacillus allii]APX71491.1 hypothetical protein BTM29_02485 [Companilactobacillus allii]USQ68572.1 DUF2975 domain-containing protein [Companilactobacillus allii]
MKISTISLRLILCIIAALLTSFTVSMFPSLLMFMHDNGVTTFNIVTFGILLFASAICSYGIIILAWRLLFLIDRNRLFSGSSIFTFKIIKYLFYTIAIVYCLAVFGVFKLISIQHIPAPFVVEIILIILGTTLGVFTSLLQRIMQNTVEHRSDPSKSQTIYLRIILIILVIFLTLILLYLFPNFISGGYENKPSNAVKVFFSLGLYLSGIISYLIIYYSWKLLYLVDNKNLFTKSGILSLKRIKQLFFSITIIYVLLSPIFTQIVSDDDSPIGVLLNVFLIMLSLMLGLFVNVLQKNSTRVMNPNSEKELNL